MTAKTYAALRDMTNDELDRYFDRQSEGRSTEFRLIYEEIARRDARKLSTAVLELARQVRNAAVAIGVLAAVVAVSLLLVFVRL